MKIRGRCTACCGLLCVGRYFLPMCDPLKNPRVTNKNILRRHMLLIYARGKHSRRRLCSSRGMTDSCSGITEGGCEKPMATSTLAQCIPRCSSSHDFKPEPVSGLEAAQDAAVHYQFLDICVIFFGCVHVLGTEPGGLTCLGLRSLQYGLLGCMD